uniref:hypothetical protein n=1 Tax=Castellaniella defragrans TaxID=75697 RepID=UPI0033411E62
MARLPRLYAPRIPQLAQAHFAQAFAQASEPAPAADLDRLRDWLGQEVARHGLALHAWVITPDRVCLLGTPTDAHGLSRVIQGLGRRMGAGMQRGRAYEGRYHNALLEPGRWVLPAMVWLESLPATLGYVDAPARWPWSSATGHIGLGADPMLADHMDYWNEGNTPFSRQAGYRQRLEAGVDPRHHTQIETALLGQWALGERIFLTHLGRLASRRVAPSPRGRPRKSASA